jgi:hypothetical protein
MDGWMGLWVLIVLAKPGWIIVTSEWLKGGWMAYFERYPLL